jgi:hypothetical protein
MDGVSSLLKIPRPYSIQSVAQREPSTKMRATKRQTEAIRGYVESQGGMCVDGKRKAEAVADDRLEPDETHLASKAGERGTVRARGVALPARRTGNARSMR